MKAYIGPYRHRWVSYVHDKYMDKKYGVQWKESSTKFEHLLEKLEDGLQWLYNITINQIIDRRSDQKIKVRVDKHDTWGMDHTLSHIILPMLKQLNDTKHGAPFVGDEDVPEELRFAASEDPGHEFETDSNWHKRWDWVMDEMIWTFEQMVEDGNDDIYFKNGILNVEGWKAHNKRIDNGTRLFGVYFRGLWD